MQAAVRVQEREVRAAHRDEEGLQPLQRLVTCTLTCPHLPHVLTPVVSVGL